MLRSREVNGMRDLGSWGWSPGIRTQWHLGRELAWASNELVSFTRVTVLWARNSSSRRRGKWRRRGRSISLRESGFNWRQRLNKYSVRRERRREHRDTSSCCHATEGRFYSIRQEHRKEHRDMSCCHTVENRFSRAQGKWWLEADKWELGVRGREDGEEYVRIQEHQEALMSWRENDSEPAMDM